MTTKGRKKSKYHMISQTMNTQFARLFPLKANPEKDSRGSLSNLLIVYRGFLTSLAHPSMPSPLLPNSISSLMLSMPFVSSRNAWLLIPPALALSAGSSSSKGSRKSAIFFESSTAK